MIFPEHISGGYIVELFSIILGYNMKIENR